MNMRSFFVALLTVTYILLLVGGLVSYAFLEPQPLVHYWTGQLFLHSAFLIVCLSSPVRLQAWLLLAALGGFAAELLGLHSALIFGNYTYTDALGWQLFGVPLAIASAWGVLLAYAAGLRQCFNPIAGAVIGACWMVAVDLLIDPLASGPLAYWRWPGGGEFYGVPLGNFAGWFAVSFIMLWLVPVNSKVPQAARLIGLSIVVFYTVLALLHQETSALALLGLALLVLDLLLLYLACRARHAAFTHFSADPPGIFVLRTLLPCSPAELHAWHGSSQAFSQLLPAWPPIELVNAPQGLEPGTRVELFIHLGPWRVPLINEIVAHNENGFADLQVRGPWGYWRHEHLFHDAAGRQSIIEDRVVYRPPFGILGFLLGDWLAQWQLQRLFHYRHARLIKVFSSSASQSVREEVQQHEHR